MAMTCGIAQKLNILFSFSRDMSGYYQKKKKKKQQKSEKSDKKAGGKD
jgi:hypothetical protein